jgi:hypothetical protein
VRDGRDEWGETALPRLGASDFEDLDSERAYSIKHAMERGLVRYLAAQHRLVPAHLEVEVRERGAHRRAGRTS